MRVLGGGVATLLLATAMRAQTLPVDPLVTPDSLTQAEFNQWFQTGSPGLNGAVTPANSVTFPDTPNASFYKWSEQMFLWLTSPAPSVYGGGDRIFNSSAFYDVSTPDANGQRTLIPLTPGHLRVFGLRVAKPNANGLPTVTDKAGLIHEVVRPQVGVIPKLQIRNQGGALMDVEKTTRDAAGKATFLDKSGKEILPRFSVSDAIKAGPGTVAPLKLQKFVIDHLPVFTDPEGNVVQVEEGQADGTALLAQNGSLIYYAITVNDVYAYFLTGAKDHQITPGTSFPVNQQDLSAITSFAAAHNKILPDTTALAIEIKTSWIEAANLPNAKDYITITASIPTYNTQDPSHWVPTGQKTALLALVGMHVVGSASGHPEMIWASFEHVGNTPLGEYAYINTNGQKITVPQSTAGKWLFCANNAPGPFNVAHINADGTKLDAISPNAITPSDTLRTAVFGAALNVSPNPIDGSAEASNSEIILMNNRVRGMLASGDIRANYFLLGATWTIGGKPPTPNGSNQVGTSRLANSTMETYQQVPVKGPAASVFNCFECHTNNTTDVSHIYSDLKPLF